MRSFLFAAAGFCAAAVFGFNMPAFAGENGLLQAGIEAAVEETPAASADEDAAQSNQLRVRAAESRTPVLLDREDNVLYYVRIDAPEGGTFNYAELEFDAASVRQIEEVKLYYSGTDDPYQAPEGRMRVVKYIPTGARAASASYSILKASGPAKKKLRLKSEFEMFPGINYLWVSVKMKDGTPLTHKIYSTLTTVSAGEVTAAPESVGVTGEPHRMGIGVRHGGDDGVAAYRIPGIVTTSKGTLVGVYDIRRNSSTDLQGDICIGVSRSTDGGQSWEPMRVAMSFNEYGGLPAAQNGVGDPSILYDPQKDRLWAVAVWTHGLGDYRNWNGSRDGFDINRTGQLMMVYSDDDGQTWSEPINVTRQVKHEDWNLLLQGPGRGIALEDGTLVFPIQYQDAERMPFSGIMYSTDHGQTWNLHEGARSNTTEAQVAELSTGELMLNMRDNRGGSRAVSTTSDFGRTWAEHPSSRSALREPVCMASLIAVKADENASGKHLLLFSNPDREKGRRDITIKLSFDDGLTWPAENQILLDDEDGWGYSCLTMIDPETVGILYECSQAHMVFQAIPLADLLNK